MLQVGPEVLSGDLQPVAFTMERTKGRCAMRALPSSVGSTLSVPCPEDGVGAPDDALTTAFSGSEKVRLSLCPESPCVITEFFNAETFYGCAVLGTGVGTQARDCGV